MSQQSHTLDEAAVVNLFAQHHLRFTRQRYAVYNALASEATHPTADQLFQKLSNTDAGISLATVYNTLEVLVKASLAQKLADGGTSARYDATVDEHLHLRDRTTGTLADVPVNLGKRLLDNLPANILHEIESELGFSINRVQIELVGEYAPPTSDH
ncbi:MAG: transcriptional repressor [Phycisphaeraceae bacterium]|nr:transcriptional repressor [Phycisphaeraceae bacterium]